MGSTFTASKQLPNSIQLRRKRHTSYHLTRDSPYADSSGSASWPRGESSGHTTFLGGPEIRAEPFMDLTLCCTAILFEGDAGKVSVHRSLHPSCFFHVSSAILFVPPDAHEDPTCMIRSSRIAMHSVHASVFTLRCRLLRLI